jgi:hypothetical protein
MSKPTGHTVWIQRNLAKCEQPSPVSWDDIERQADNYWSAYRPLVQEIRARGMDRSLYGGIGLMGFSLSMGGKAGWDDPYLNISHSSRNPGHLTFKYIGSNRDHRQDWRATYPPEQVLSAFYRFVTRVGWFPEGHPMLAGLENGIPHEQA